MTEGERWTRTQLDELRGGGYAPAAWQRFLRASVARAGDTRRARPALARQASRWSLHWLLLVCASRTRPLRALFPRVPWAREALWWLPASAMLRWHLGMVEGTSGERRERLGAADALTLTRLWLSPRVARSDCSRRHFRRLLAAGCATDLVDGPLARRAGATRLGVDLDQVVDVCFYLSATSAARRAGWISAPAAWTVALRSAGGISYVCWVYFTQAARPATPRSGLHLSAAALLPAGLALGATGERRAGSRLVAGASLLTFLLQASSRTRRGRATGAEAR